jgi:UDP-N-acetylmuramoyl-tripeptide--D-alanyl-D-alanine ligase
MIAGLDLLAAMPGHKIAVLGHMSEISDSEKQHLHVAEVARSHGIDVMACETSLYGIAAMSVEEIAEQIRKLGDVCVLVKGSRVAATERVVQLLGG